MYAKIFQQIFDSSIAENWQIRLVFEDMLKLCDINGTVDMTHEAIARRTNVPLQIVKDAICELEKPDPRSRNPENEGRRIVRLDQHRDWGWIISNYAYYRSIASEEQRREKTRERTRKWRGKSIGDAAVTQGDAEKPEVTQSDAGDAMQRKRHDKALRLGAGSVFKKKPHNLTQEGKELALRFETALATEWINDAGKWINRIKATPKECESVIGEVESAARESRIDTTPARFAEHIWKWLTKQPMDDTNHAGSATA